MADIFAFPLSSDQIGQQGMGLRDYFAAAALTGLIAKKEAAGLGWIEGLLKTISKQSEALRTIISYEKDLAKLTGI